jgi:hypothetical protein
MPNPPQAAELPLAPAPDRVSDPEFEAFPEPRRPGKRLTLIALSVTAVVAVLLALSLRGEARYSLVAGPPVDVGNLASFKPDPSQSNHWIRGAGSLGTKGAIRYSRPLEDDTFRLAPVVGNPNLWVEIRVPAGLEGPHFVPPASFVGRLVPVSAAGLRHSSLPDSVADVGEGSLPSGAWLLIDGEAPPSTRWALGLLALFVAFAAFNVWGLVRLLRPIHD